MHLYTVIFERTVTYLAERTIEAPDEDEAYVRGLEMADDITDWQFEEEDIDIIGVDNDADYEEDDEEDGWLW